MKILYFIFIVWSRTIWTRIATIVICEEIKDGGLGWRSRRSRRWMLRPWRWKQYDKGLDETSLGGIPPTFIAFALWRWLRFHRSRLSQTPSPYPICLPEPQSSRLAISNHSLLSDKSPLSTPSTSSISNVISLLENPFRYFFLGDYYYWHQRFWGLGFVLNLAQIQIRKYPGCR